MKRLRITVEGKSYDVEVELLDENSPPSTSREVAPVKAIEEAPPAAQSGEDTIVSPLSAVVVSLDVAVGDVVEEGQKVITLEAMKMNTTVTATSAGTVGAILVSVGDSVEEGKALIQLQ